MIAPENQWLLFEPEMPRTDVSGSEFESGAPTSEEEVEKKKSRTKRAPKSPPMVVLESWFSVISVALFLFVPRWCRNDSGSFRKWRCVYGRGDWWAVEGASHSCSKEAGTFGWGPQHDVPESFHSRGRRGSCCSRHLMMVIFVFNWGIY